MPKEFRLPGTELRVRGVGRGILLEPMEFDVATWLAALGHYKDVPFMEGGGEQPPTPKEDTFSDT